MSEQIVEGPDGQRFAFPADMSSDSINTIMMQTYSAKPEQPKPQEASLQTVQPQVPQEDISPITHQPYGDGVLGSIQRVVDPAQAAINDFPPIKGIRDIGDGLGQLASRGIDAVFDSNGAERVDQHIATNEQRYQDQYGDNGFATAGRIGGQILGTMPLAAGSGGATVLGRTLHGAGVGAGAGALTPVTNGDYWDEKAEDIGLGVAGGAVAPHLFQGIGNVLSGARNQAAKIMNDAGVRVTPGQALGGAWKAAEEKLASVPVLGDAIRKAYERGYASFNETVARRVLEPIGGLPTKGIAAGRELVDDVGQQVSKAYDEILPKIQVTIDDQFTRDIDALRGVTAELSEDMAAKFQHIVGTKVLNKAQNGRWGGEQWKKAESELSKLVASAQRSSSMDERELGNALSGARDALRGLLERGAGPEYREALSRINESYARLKIFERAASSLGNTGVVTPKQYLSAARAKDTSLDKRAYARGNAREQEFAEQAVDTLAPTIPNSGTTDRAMMGIGMGGAYAVDPTAAIGLAASTAPYAAPVQKQLVNALLNRPQTAKSAGQLIEGAIQPSNAATQRLIQALTEQQ